MATTRRSAQLILRSRRLLPITITTTTTTTRPSSQSPSSPSPSRHSSSSSSSSSHSRPLDGRRNVNDGIDGINVTVAGMRFARGLACGAAPLLSSTSAAFVAPPRRSPSSPAFFFRDAVAAVVVAGGGCGGGATPSSFPLRRLSATAAEPASAEALETAAAATVAAAAESSSGTGRVLSRRVSSDGSSSFVVVRILEDDGWDGKAIHDGAAPATATANAAAAEPGARLAGALFGGSSAAPPPPKPVVKKVATASDADPTGRTVAFADGSTGLVVAHRDPISFVLAGPPRDDGGAEADEAEEEEETCSVFATQASIDPSSVPPGSVVDYLGRHLAVAPDGSVSVVVVAPPRADGEKGAEEGSRAIFVPIPKISDIGLIDSPLVTGITAIDSLTPIGKGQNMLVIGEEEESDEGVNKRGWMINLLRNVVVNHRGGSGGNGNNAMRCFYCLTSADPGTRRRVLDYIANAGIRDDVVTVLSSAPSATRGLGEFDDDARIGAAEAVAAAAAACTLAEHHALTHGGDAVVVVDDVNLHKSLWDMTTRELVGVFGINSVVEADLNGGSSSEMRGYFSGLIQRAARFNAKRGGGSVTLILLSTLPDPNADVDVDDGDAAAAAFDASDFDSMSEKIRARIRMLVNAGVPLTSANLRKIKLPVPRPSAAEDRKRLALQHVEDLISMSDGQVWLDAGQGRSPPLDPSRSITRVGVGADTPCRADAPALRSVVGSLRFEFQQAMDLSGGDGASSRSAGDARQMRRRDAFLLAMHQESNEGRKLSDECAVLLAASRGHLDGVLADGGKAGTSRGREAIEGMLKYVGNEAGGIMRSIDDTLDLSRDDRNALEETIKAYYKLLT